MFSNLSIHKCGDYYKITSVRLKTSSSFDNSFTRNYVNNSKQNNNLCRAQNTIQDLVLTNNFKYFFTLTFKPQFDRFNFQKLHNLFKNTIRNIKRTYNIHIDYLIVPEQHKNGAWHFHGFLSKDIELLIRLNEFNYEYIPEFKTLGYHNIENVKDIKRASSYVTKYVVKNLGNGIKLFKHSYFCSVGLKRPIKVMSRIYNNEKFNLHFFDFRNDYCCKKIISKEEFRALEPLLQRV